MAKQIIAGDGKAVKTILTSQWSNSVEGWDYYSGAPDAEKQNELYGAVAAVFRAANLTADATSNIPFMITDLKGNEIDNSHPVIAVLQQLSLSAKVAEPL
jgi:hypothetical protein